MVERSAPSHLKLRTVFISDIHLGFKGCSADWLLDFLHHVEMDTLFLVGDIIDVWSMQKSMFWPQSHNNVLRTILGKAKRGTKVIFVPGNHDEVFRDFVLQGRYSAKNIYLQKRNLGVEHRVKQ